MLLQGSPKIHLSKINGLWNVWVESPLEVLDEGLAQLPRYVPTRDLEKGETMGRHKVEFKAFSTRFMVNKESDARILAEGLAKAFEEAEIVEGSDAIIDIPQFDLCMP